MKQIMTDKGKIRISDVPVPLAGDGEVLVQVCYSCVSQGTEMGQLTRSGQSLYERAITQPRAVKKALEILRKDGLGETIRRIKDEVGSMQPIGYSASGIVLEVGKDISDISSGDTVACAGAGRANHAEFIAIPRNLVVKVPKSLDLQSASTVAVGSIALQAVRRADTKLGETVAVIGLGTLGQIIVQILKANGCRTIGMDIDSERLERALSLGLDEGIDPRKEDSTKNVTNLTGGYGADAVIIAASAKTNDVINQATEIARRKGRVVIVGAVGLDIDRKYFYEKELDILMSTSYGPGRYDEEYEARGKDYPYGYVRWTENRNMDAYIKLMDERKIEVRSMIDKVYAADDASSAYADLKKEGKDRPLIALLEYAKDAPVERKVIISESGKTKTDKIRVAVIGAGAFSKAVHLPNLRKLKKFFDIQAILTKNGSGATAIAKEYGAQYATTDYEEILNDKNVDMVLIATRHNLHASMAIDAAKAGKAVFLEKPMALNRDELKALTDVLEQTKVPFTVGFNRRFSPHMRKVKEVISKRTSPMIINYRMNAGFIPKESWVHTAEGGGRNIGEACHIYDLFNFLTENAYEKVDAVSVKPEAGQYGRDDNFVATIRYEDGSVCNLIYTALGSSSLPKEQMDIYFDGKVITLNDYKKTDIFGAGIMALKTSNREKGYSEELIEFMKVIKGETVYSIPLWQLVQATDISFQVEEGIKEI